MMRNSLSARVLAAALRFPRQLKRLPRSGSRIAAVSLCAAGRPCSGRPGWLPPWPAPGPR